MNDYFKDNMDKTRIVSYFLNKRRKEINKYDVNPENLQTKVLINLPKRAQHTEWGHSHNYNNIKNYNEVANSTPINSYEELNFSRYVYIEKSYINSIQCDFIYLCVNK